MGLLYTWPMSCISSVYICGSVLHESEVMRSHMTPLSDEAAVCACCGVARQHGQRWWKHRGGGGRWATVSHCYFIFIHMLKCGPGVTSVCCLRSRPRLCKAPWASLWRPAPRSRFDQETRLTSDRVGLHARVQGGAGLTGQEQTSTGTVG